MPGTAWAASPASQGMTTITFVDSTTWTSGASSGTYVYDWLMVTMTYSPSSTIHYALAIIDAAHHVQLARGDAGVWNTWDLTR
jgi:hypothetical protein